MDKAQEIIVLRKLRKVAIACVIGLVGIGLFALFSGCSVLPIHLNVGEGKPYSHGEASNARAKSAPRYTKVAAGKWVDDKNKVLINGAPVDRAQYPWVLWIRSGGAMCTASLVGPEVALTAAHCVGDGEAITFRHDGGNYSGVCTHHPDYRSNDHDIALCKLTSAPKVKPIPVRLNHYARMDMRIQILGFGCTRPGGGGGNDGTLRMGYSRLRGAVGRDLYSRATGDDKAALCFGDSGGPVLDPEGHQLAVNSKGNIRDQNWTSRMDRWAKDWVFEWAQKNQVEICHDEKPCAEQEEPEPEEFHCENEGIQISGKLWPKPKKAKKSYPNSKSRAYGGY